MAETRAVQLLTIDKVLVHQVYHGESIPLGAGPCQVLLASLDDNAEQAYLLLSIEKEPGLPQEKQGASNKEPLEIVVSSQHQVRVQRSESTGSRYNLHNGELEGAEVQLTLPFAAIQNGQDEAFADVINQYCGLVGAEGGVGDNGRMDLVDEDGNLLGTLDGSMRDSLGAGKGEAPTLTTESADKSVAGQQAETKPDWLLSGAERIAGGMASISGWAGGHFTRAADRYTGSASNSGSNSPLPPPASTEKAMDSTYKGSGGGVDYGDEKKGGFSSTGINAGEYASGDYAGSSSAKTTTSGMSASGHKNMVVHPSVSKGLQSLSTQSGSVLRLSNSARDRLLNVSEGMGRKVGGVGRSKESSSKPPGAVRSNLTRGAEAVNIVLDGFDNAVGGLLTSAGTSTGRAIDHRFGSDAKAASGLIGKTGKNAFLVYQDVSGVRRKLLLKVVGGTLKGRTPEGKEITISGPKGAGGESGAGGPSAMSQDTDSIEHDYVSTSSAPQQQQQQQQSSSSSSQGLPPPSYREQQKQ